MSGLEIAGVLLGTFPLIISGLEHWRDAAKVGGFYWRVRKEYNRCRSDVQFYEIVYKRNLRELLLPIVDDVDEVTRLLGDPGGKDWNNAELQGRLEQRLQESYSVYLEIIGEMNETAEELRKELCFGKSAVQNMLAPPSSKGPSRSQSPQPPERHSRLASTKLKFDFETFRVKFSFNEQVRNELCQRLQTCNDRLEKLLSTSDRISSLQSTPPNPTRQTSLLEAAFKNAWKKSDLLFKAIHKAWQCPCQPYHFANLRLEHRTLPDICFEIILMFAVPSSYGRIPWFWKELQCGHMIGCATTGKVGKPSNSAATSSSLPIRSSNKMPPILSSKMDFNPPRTDRRKKVAFEATAPSAPQISVDLVVDPSVNLCDLLGNEEVEECMGIIGHNNETYHLHSSRKRKRPLIDSPLTLGDILSADFEGHLSRRQRYSIALLIASSVAQLQFTPWLQTSLTKEDVFFFPSEDDTANIPYGEPFIRQGFDAGQPEAATSEAKDCNFYSLGILLLELCFGMRLEDHKIRQRYPAGEGEAKNAFDLMAAIKWSHGVEDEGGEDYASAVKWCLTAGASNTKHSWRGEIIKNVIQPLEICQEHFKTASI
jgi:hypothetical protein